MKVNKFAWEVSVRFRYNYLGQVQHYFNVSPSKLAGHMTVMANDKGYSDRKNAISGNALVSYAKSGNAPLWLCRVALDLILSKGYMPDSDDEWISLVSLLILDVDNISKEFLNTLPSQISRYGFEEWFNIVR